MSYVMEMQIRLEKQKYSKILAELTELQSKKQQEKYGEIQNPFALLPRVEEAIERKDELSIRGLSAQITSLWRNTFK
jgi:hypothetical protein